MAKKQRMTDVYLSPGYDMPSDYASLSKMYRTLAKAADQRMVRLEGYRHEENFRVADKWAYSRAVRDIKAWSPSADFSDPNWLPRWNKKPPESVSLLQSKIQDIKTFLLSPTSTKQGILNVYKKRAETLNSKYGTNFRWDEIGTYFESRAWEEAYWKFGSDSAMDVIATLQKNKEEVIKGIKNSNAVDIKVPDKMEERLVNKFLEENGKEILELFTSLH